MSRSHTWLLGALTFLALGVSGCSSERLFFTSFEESDDWLPPMASGLLTYEVPGDPSGDRLVFIRQGGTSHIFVPTAVGAPPGAEDFPAGVQSLSVKHTDVEVATVLGCIPVSAPLTSGSYHVAVSGYVPETKGIPPVWFWLVESSRVEGLVTPAEFTRGLAALMIRPTPDGEGAFIIQPGGDREDLPGRLRPGEWFTLHMYVDLDSRTARYEVAVDGAGSRSETLDLPSMPSGWSALKIGVGSVPEMRNGPAHDEFVLNFISISKQEDVEP